MNNSNGLISTAKFIKSPFYNNRPANMTVDLLVIHCISLPEGCYGTEHIQKLFTGCLDCTAHESFNDLQGLQVSAHFVIRRDGEVEQYVPVHKRAWHAGVSSFEGREGCNDFSIGIELEGTDHSSFSKKQYSALIALTKAIQQLYPQITRQRIVGHSDIAPGRKTDPGSAFDWKRYLDALTEK